jgi:predicted AlkP superfamily pyrophosphatase or phosphodiesterase
MRVDGRNRRQESGAGQVLGNRGQDLSDQVTGVGNQESGNRTQQKKLLIVQVAGLGYDFLQKNHGALWEGLTFHSAASVFPAVTCTAQASFRTAATPGQHGMVGNGLWDRRYVKARFWEQSSRLVEGPRIWDSFREAGHRVGVLFWQQSLGERADVLISPAPIHKHHGGMVQDCYSQPVGLYADLLAAVGKPFNLMHYWGPLASHRASSWITDATVALLDSESAPDLCLTYLPVLDYDLQRFGLTHAKSRRALSHALAQLSQLKDAATRQGYELLIFGDYALGEVSRGPIYPNLELRRQGLLSVRRVGKMAYADHYSSKAFVMADHEVGHVYVPDVSVRPAVRDALENLAGIAEVLDQDQQRERGVGHPNAGEFMLIAEEGAWIAYPWWEDRKEAPDYASHVDIHNKPGYDPAELFFGWPPGSVCQNPDRIRGTHGRVGPGREIAWASTCIEGAVDSLVSLAGAVQEWLGEQG